MSEYRRKKPSIRREGVDRSQGFGGHYEPLQVNERTKGPNTAATTADIKAPAPQPAAAETPKRDAESPALQDGGGAQHIRNVREGRGQAEQPAARAEAPAKRQAKTPANRVRQAVRKVALTAYPKEEQRAPLEAVTSEAVPIMDMVKLAGRRALARFVPKAEYEAIPDVPRMKSTYRYTTTKHVSEGVLDKLHSAVNPLGLKSDNEMLRGQFEPLFWSELDAIIEDLEKK